MRARRGSGGGETAADYHSPARRGRIGRPMSEPASWWPRLLFQNNRLSDSLCPPSGGKAKQGSDDASSPWDGLALVEVIVEMLDPTPPRLRTNIRRHGRPLVRRPRLAGRRPRRRSAHTRRRGVVTAPSGSAPLPKFPLDFPHDGACTRHAASSFASRQGRKLVVDDSRSGFHARWVVGYLLSAVPLEPPTAGSQAPAGQVGMRF